MEFAATSSEFEIFPKNPLQGLASVDQWDLELHKQRLGDLHRSRHPSAGAGYAGDAGRIRHAAGDSNSLATSITRCSFSAAITQRDLGVGVELHLQLQDVPRDPAQIRELHCRYASDQLVLVCR
jgi:hypothetical protein